MDSFYITNSGDTTGEMVNGYTSFATKYIISKQCNKIIQIQSVRPADQTDESINDWNKNQLEGPAFSLFINNGDGTR